MSSYTALGGGGSNGDGDADLLVYGPLGRASGRHHQPQQQETTTWLQWLRGVFGGRRGGRRSAGSSAGQMRSFNGVGDDERTAGSLSAPLLSQPAGALPVSMGARSGSAALSSTAGHPSSAALAGPQLGPDAVRTASIGSTGTVVAVQRGVERGYSADLGWNESPLHAGGHAGGDAVAAVMDPYVPAILSFTGVHVYVERASGSRLHILKGVSGVAGPGGPCDSYEDDGGSGGGSGGGRGSFGGHAGGSSGGGLSRSKGHPGNQVGGGAFGSTTSLASNYSSPARPQHHSYGSSLADAAPHAGAISAGGAAPAAGGTGGDPHGRSNLGRGVIHHPTGSDPGQLLGNFAFTSLRPAAPDEDEGPHSVSLSAGASAASIHGSTPRKGYGAGAGHGEGVSDDGSPQHSYQQQRQGGQAEHRDRRGSLFAVLGPSGAGGWAWMGVEGGRVVTADQWCNHEGAIAVVRCILHQGLWAGGCAVLTRQGIGTAHDRMT
jgi:hypothetical protein